jgi:hypothetical protein
MNQPKARGPEHCALVVLTPARHSTRKIQFETQGLVEGRRFVILAASRCATEPFLALRRVAAPVANRETWD